MNKQDLERILKTYSGSAINLCVYVLEQTKELSFEEQVEFVSELCEQFGMVKSDKSFSIPEVISEDDKENLKDEYGKYVDGVLEASLKKAYNNTYTKDEFYRLLWGNFVKTEMLATDEEKAFALYYIAIDRKVPYFQMEKGLLMENDEFNKLRRQTKESIQRVEFILANSYKQKTEEASLILTELINLGSFEEQTVVLAALLASMRKEQKQMLDAVKEVIEEIRD